MAKNYSITFVSLRAGTTYVVHIGGGTGAEVPLIGGAQPFTTQEDDNEDVFTPIRTQSGYLRVVDNGLDANGNAWNWKDLIPATDTSRPVTLTAGGTVVWQGFMQAQDFGSVLYGNPQEREFPIQCVLTITQGTDINYQQTGIQNMAYLLKKIVDSIPYAQRFTDFYIQGGSDAQAWLMKCIDWQNFVAEEDGSLTARFKCFECLEDFCTYWGWTARTQGATLYLTCADDNANETNWLHLTYANLITMAGGTSAGTTSDTFKTATLSGDIFANTNNDEYVQRGVNKCVVDVDTNRADDNVIDIFTQSTVEAMEAQGWQGSSIHGARYTNDLLTVDNGYIKVNCRSGYGSLNVAQVPNNGDNENINVIRIKKTGGNSVTPFVTMETNYEHNFSGGFLMLYGSTYRFANKFELPFEQFDFGNTFMFARIGIGKDREHAVWWDGYDRQWKSTVSHCRVGIANKPFHLDNMQEYYTYWEWPGDQAPMQEWQVYNILELPNVCGKLFIDLLGTDHAMVEDIDGEKSFELRDFTVTFRRNAGVMWQPGFWDHMRRFSEKDRPTSFGYKATNSSNFSDEKDIDGIYASDNTMKFCFGEIFNADGTFFSTVPYNNGLISFRPEQHLANRVASYWRTSRRRVKMEMKSNVTVTEGSGSVAIGDINPRHKLSFESGTFHPISISREWRDDLTQMTIIEI